MATEKNNFYITTPIYYVNGKPHIGHAYTTILADVLARYHRLLGIESWFLTGTDEHGTKVQEAAEAAKVTPIEQCDATVGRFKELWQKLNISNSDFIRTTEERHKSVVQRILQNLYENDLIYKAQYKGWYCTPCERFFTEKDLIDGKNCPDCNRQVKALVESNYFFRMSKYQDWLITYIKEHPEFIQPTYRANETLGFLKQPLSDLCISRPKSRLSWGIELPFDSNYVCYVWFDALINYISAIGYSTDNTEFNKWWPASYQLIGKDILTTHTVYWPTMLKAIGIRLPKTIYAHGWWLVGEDKMSKSLGNVINPMEMVDKYGVDAFRYFLLAEMSLGQDASFTEDAFIGRYNTDLANDLGNFLNRVTKFILKLENPVVPEYGQSDVCDKEFKQEILTAVENMQTSINNMKLDKGIESVIAAVRSGNRYLEKTAPWKLLKEGNIQRLNSVLYSAAEALRIISGLLYPVMPEKAMSIRESLGLKNEAIDIGEISAWGKLKPGTKIKDTGVLFARIETEDKKKEDIQIEKNKPSKAITIETTNFEEVSLIGIEDFSKVKLKTAKVIGAERVPGKDRILKLSILVGEETRQIVAGVAQFYSPETIIGKTIVVVSNLKPAKIAGLDSNGMLLAAKIDGMLKLVTVDGDIAPGASVG